MGRLPNVTTFSSVGRFKIRKKLLCDNFFVDFEFRNFFFQGHVTRGAKWQNMVFHKYSQK